MDKTNFSPLSIYCLEESARLFYQKQLVFDVAYSEGIGLWLTLKETVGKYPLTILSSGYVYRWGAEKPERIKNLCENLFIQICETLIKKISIQKKIDERRLYPLEKEISVAFQKKEKFKIRNDSEKLSLWQDYYNLAVWNRRNAEERLSKLNQALTLCQEAKLTINEKDN